MSDIRLYNDDCFNIFPQIEDKSVDMICCDLPYGTTSCKWDVILPFDQLWKEYERIIKDNGAIVLFSQQPFTSELIHSNLKLYKYNWIWVKDNATNFLHSHFRPLKITEDICVFGKASTFPSKKGNHRQSITYNPQMRGGYKPYTCKSGKHKVGSAVVDGSYDKVNNYITVSNGERYPINLIKFNRDKEKMHPTQKPVALLEYLIKTYTNEGMLVLDNCMGSGTCGVACKKLNRKFIGIEKEKEYYDIAEKRINEAIIEPTLFGEIK